MGVLEIIKYGPPDERAPLSRRPWVAGDVRGVSGRERGKQSDGPMLAEGQALAATRVSRWIALVAVGLCLLSLSVSLPARGEQPSWAPGPSATRIVTWMMNDSVGLASSDVSFAGGNASLAWTPVSRMWSHGSDFSANGSLGPNVTAGPSGLSLRADTSNRVSNGNFTSPASWAFTNGTADNTTARWLPSQDVAGLNHTSGPTAMLWDPLSNIATTWTLSASVGSTSNVYQAPGAMGDFVNVTAGVTQYAGAQHIGTVNWAAYDQFRMALFQNASAPAAFNISAVDGTFTSQTTVPVALVAGWQTVSVDLDQLGSSRSSLSSLTLRIVGAGGQKLPSLSYYFAEIQLGKAKQADTTARVSQTFDKANTTTRLPGSATLSFDWMIENFTGVAEGLLGANLTGPGGTFVTVFPSTFSSGWRHFSADVSSYTAASGVYNLSFGLQIVLDNITASNVTAFVDNVAFVYPDRGNGSYLSSPRSMGDDSQFLTVSWTASLPSASTTVRLGFRSGNTTTAMGSWSQFSSPGTYPLSDFGLYFQVRADLNTTNASLSPTLSTLTLATTHRAGVGAVISGNYSAPADFLFWRSFQVDDDVPASTAVAFSAGDGSSWVHVEPGGNLTALGIGSRIQWKAVFNTSDGLRSPTLARVFLVYDYLGPPVRVVFTAFNQSVPTGATLSATAGESVPLGVLVYDAGSHPVPVATFQVGWHVGNASAGSIEPNGTYTAGNPGSYVITVTIASYGGGPLVYASLPVNVTAASGSSAFPSSLWDYWPVFVVAIAALAGFSIYELVIRRLFAIDDVFLIAKDGRLIIHNTRRMRADRDEDILSGMLTAIMAFLRDSDPEENGEFKKFEVGGKTTMLERGKHVYLTAIYSGRVPGWARKDLHRFMTDLEDHFGDAFASWSGSPEDLHGLKEYMQRFVTHMRYRGDSGAHRVEN